jgi:fructokinase
MHEMKELFFVGIGEVLYDVFEDGTETLGGAPLNFAVHAHQLADRLGVGKGIIVSCIHADQRGTEILRSLSRLGMSTRYIGNDTSHPTGMVSIFMRNGEPGYQIEPGAAWDFIAHQVAFEELAGRCDAICFGSLAQRSPVTRDTIRKFLHNAPQAIRLYDVNLRRNTLTGQPGFSREIIEYGCRTATIIKANRSELFAVLDILNIGRLADETLGGIRHGMEALLTHFPARAVVVTRGAEGTIVLTREGDLDVSAPASSDGKLHPVGAGDACSAGILFGLTLGWDIHRTMELANLMGSDVAAQLSATPPLSDAIMEFARTQMRGYISNRV